MTPTTPLQFRPADRRGHTRLGWLESRHSFSFGHYQEPGNEGFSVLRVINDDRIAPGTGFGEHPHRDMEILTWVLAGSLKHGDNLGHQQVLQPGELQAMSAGTGIRHSEVNGSSTQPAHFLQIWLEPSRAGLPPRYDQRAFAAEGRQNQWQVLAAGPERAAADSNAMPLYQDATLAVTELAGGQSLPVTLPAGRRGYLHLATGQATLAGQPLTAGDAVTFAGPAELHLHTDGGAQALFFDLP